MRQYNLIFLTASSFSAVAQTAPSPSTTMMMGMGRPTNMQQCLNLPLNATSDDNSIENLYEEVDSSLYDLLFETLNGSMLAGIDDVLDNNNRNNGANDCESNIIQISASRPEREDGENADPYFRFDESYDFYVTLNITFDLTDDNHGDTLLPDMPVLVQIASLPNWDGIEDLMIQLSPSVQINLAEYGEETDGNFKAFVTVEVPHMVSYPKKISSVVSSSLLESMVFTTAARVVMLSDLDSNETSDNLYQAVISRRIMGSSVLYYQEPVSLVVDDFYKISSTVTISLLVSVNVFFLFSVIRYRDNTVMKLSQYTFLIALLVAAILAMVGARAITPENDTTCRIGPIPAITFSTLVTYIVLGRLWRCSLLMSSFMTHQKDPRSECKRKRLAKINDVLSYLTQWRALIERAIPQNVKHRRSHLIKPSTQLRRSVTTVELSRLLLVLVLPTLIMDIVYYINVSTGESHSYMAYDSTGFYRRQDCLSANGNGPIYVTIFGLFVFSLCFCAYMAHLTNDLPSLFNETRLIYRSIVTSFILTLVLIPFLVLTDHDTSSPNIGSFAYLFIFLALPFSMSWSLIYPKLIVVWSGERVVVSSLLRKQSRQANINSKHSNKSVSTSMVISTRSSRPYTISDTTSIPKWIEQNLAELQSRMQSITNTSLAGMLVDKMSWVTFKELIVAFADEMRNVEICYDDVSNARDTENLSLVE